MSNSIITQIKEEPLDIKPEIISSYVNEESIGKTTYYTISELTFRCDYPSYVKGTTEDVNIGPFKCLICGKWYTTKPVLDSHIKMHAKQTEYFRCKICSKDYTMQSHLNYHMRTHAGPYECDICHEIINKRRNLVQHMRTHADEQAYQCFICQRRFKRQGDVAMHMRAHADERPHECEVCHDIFLQKGDLTVHMRTHTWARPHECDFCNMKFVLKSNYEQHKCRGLTIERSLKCDICDLTFRGKGRFTSHMNTHNSGNVDFATHMRVNDGEKPHECKNTQECLICRSSFTQDALAMHMRPHASEKPLLRIKHTPNILNKHRQGNNLKI